MTIAEALRAIDAREARVLLSHVSGLPQASLLAHPESDLPEEVAASYRALCARRKSGEPIAYIVGSKEFYSLELQVGPAVLIPRPETELLVELALRHEFEGAVDLGTGSGAIALALKKNRPAARIVAVDASARALETAKRNAAKLGLEVEFRHGRWFEPLGTQRFDLIVANPPYVAVGDPHLAGLAFEPQEALVAGVDGLDAIREIAAHACARLLPGGWLLVEHGRGQEEAVRALLSSGGLEEVATWPDLAGIGRVSGGKR